MKPTTPRILSLIVFLGASFSFGESYGQTQDVPLSSPAFESDCFFPVIGVDIDTIYGSHDGQLLGNYAQNIGLVEGERYGKVGCYGLPGHEQNLTTFRAGPGFDLHNLQDLKEFGFNFQQKQRYYFAHFRSPKIQDLIVFGGEEHDTIYWADDNGKYDKSRFTTLRVSLPSDGAFQGYFYPPYITYLTSDTVEDIVEIQSTANNNNHDSLYLLLYKGENLYKAGKIAFEDTSLNYGKPITWSWSGQYADYRGAGRKDAIIINRDANDPNNNLNTFFYRNDPPFTLDKFANALRYDTLLSVYENPQLLTDQSHSLYPFFRDLEVQAFPRANKNDHSVDFLAIFKTNKSNSGTLWIFRGGPEFGSKHLYLDTPDFAINPKKYDSQLNNKALFGYLVSLGDLTGTGNTVIAANGYDPFAEISNNTFFVLGNALNDKIDTFFEGDHTTLMIPDTITADGDNLQDVIFDNGTETLQNDFDKGWRNVGSLGLLHGTTRIPVHLNPDFAVEERHNVDVAPNHIVSYPNPCEEKTVLTFDNCTSSQMRVQVYTATGALVHEESTPAVEGLQQYALSLASQPAGMYVVRLSCPALGWTGAVNVVKTGGVQASQRFDLKKMVGR
ncbi:MAG: T9SS type A sorting domain-containing protein [Bacteroidota bacterium]|nr:T9SS type A sorting domain-containing protein [Bacteroidota bacterium]